MPQCEVRKGRHAFVTSDELYDSRWMLAYEAAVRGWLASLKHHLNHPFRSRVYMCFGPLAPDWPRATVTFLSSGALPLPEMSAEAISRESMIRAGDLIMQRVAEYREKASELYYEVMLFQKECPSCGNTALVMTQDSHCQCRHCELEIDPTVQLQTCPDCDHALILKVYHYWCPSRRHPVRSLSCFDERVFNNQCHDFCFCRRVSVGSMGTPACLNSDRSPLPSRLVLSLECVASPQVPVRPWIAPGHSLYIWYSPRQRFDLTVTEFAFDHHHKLYRTGPFFDLKADPDERSALTTLSPDQAAAKAMLQPVLDQDKDARPAALDRQLQEAMKGQPEGPKKKGREVNQLQKRPGLSPFEIPLPPFSSKPFWARTLMMRGTRKGRRCG